MIKFHLKIAKISLQKQTFLGIGFPNSTFLPCMHEAQTEMYDFTRFDGTFKIETLGNRTQALFGWEIV